MLRSLLAGKELDANQYCRCGSVKCDSTCSVKFLFTYVCRRKSLASRLIKNNYIYGLTALPFMKLVHRPHWEWNNFIRVFNRVKLCGFSIIVYLRNLKCLSLRLLQYCFWIKVEVTKRWLRKAYITWQLNMGIIQFTALCTLQLTPPLTEQRKIDEIEATKHNLLKMGRWIYAPKRTVCNGKFHWSLFSIS